MKRTFVAIKLPISKQTAELVEDIKVQLSDEKIKWVDTWNMHITLYFLGDTDEELIGDIGEALKEKLKDFKSFIIQCKGLGIFKNIYNPKVLWFGIKKLEVLKYLKEKVDNVLEEFGFAKEEREFKPHLTLGRIKYIKNQLDLKNILSQYKDADIQEFKICEVVFYESQLTPAGPIYKVIKKFELN